MKTLYSLKNIKSLPYVFQFGSDSVFTTPVARHAFLQSRYTDVYFYQFSYKGKVGQLLVNKTIEGKLISNKFQLRKEIFIERG